MTDIFDEVLAGREANAQATEATEATAEATETNASEWPKTLTLPAGEVPEGAVQVAEFAKLVNEKLVKNRVTELLAEDVAPADAVMEAMAAQVSQASFYQAVKGQRNALPHYVVKHETAVVDAEGNETGAVETTEKTYIPVDVALDWWMNRPARGAGAGRTSEEDLEKRLYRAGKKVADLKSAEERLEKLRANVERMRGQVEDYQKRLEADGKTLGDATAAYEAQVEKDEAENAIGDNE